MNVAAFVFWWRKAIQERKVFVVLGQRAAPGDRVSSAALAKGTPGQPAPPERVNGVSAGGGDLSGGVACERGRLSGGIGSGMGAVLVLCTVLSSRGG